MKKFGESGPVKVHLSDLVSEVFKKRIRWKRQKSFSLPEQRKQHRKNQKSQRHGQNHGCIPEYFCFFGRYQSYLYFILIEFHNPNAYPGFIFMGAMTVPFALLIFSGKLMPEKYQYIQRGFYAFLSAEFCRWSAR